MDRRRFLLTTGTTATAAWMGMGPGFSQASHAADATASKDEKPSAALEQRLAQFAAGVKYEDLPKEAVQACKRYLLDALACALGAVGTVPAKIAEETFRKAFPSTGSATIIGKSHSISTEGATLINGTMIRELEFNDIYFGKDPAHPSEIISTAIACCEEAGRSGRDLIEAIVVGYEIEVRLADAFSWASRGFISSSAAGFVAPLVAGKAWRMPAEQMANAVGISGPRQLIPLAINSGDISMMKSVQPGFAAMDAVFATRLAAAGLTGVTRSIEWLTANILPKDASISVDLDPRHYLLTKVGLRRFSLQGDLQAMAEAGVNLHPKIQGQAETIKEVIVQTYPETIHRGVASPERYHPASRLTADHSLPICLAIALLDGDVTIRQFNDGRWNAPDVLALAQKVKVEVGQSLIVQMPDGHGTIVEVHLDNGQIIKETVLIPEGDAEKPMSAPAMEKKFRQFADLVLGKAGASSVLSYIDRLEEIKNIRTLTEALRKSA
jgi:2-methylcitrate dehydratase